MRAGDCFASLAMADWGWDRSVRVSSTRFPRILIGPQQTKRSYACSFRSACSTGVPAGRVGCRHTVPLSPSAPRSPARPRPASPARQSPARPAHDGSYRRLRFAIDIPALAPRNFAGGCCGSLCSGSTACGSPRPTGASHRRHNADSQSLRSKTARFAPTNLRAALHHRADPDGYGEYPGHAQEVGAGHGTAATAGGLMRCRFQMIDLDHGASARHLRNHAIPVGRPPTRVEQQGNPRWTCRCRPPARRATPHLALRRSDRLRRRLSVASCRGRWPSRRRAVAAPVPIA